MIYKNNNLVLENTTLNLKSIYENYPYVQENALFLTDFIQVYKIAKDDKSASIYEKENNIVVKIENKNKYRKIETLYLNKDNGLPEKLEIEDINQNIIVYILYNEIKLNNF